MPSSGFWPYDVNWQQFDVPLVFLFRLTSGFQKYSHNAQVLIPVNIQVSGLALLLFLKLASSIGPEQ